MRANRRGRCALSSMLGPHCRSARALRRAALWVCALLSSRSACARRASACTLPGLRTKHICLLGAHSQQDSGKSELVQADVSSDGAGVAQRGLHLKALGSAGMQPLLRPHKVPAALHIDAGRTVGLLCPPAGLLAGLELRFVVCPGSPATASSAHTPQKQSFFSGGLVSKDGHGHGAEMVKSILQAR